MALCVESWKDLLPWPGVPLLLKPEKMKILKSAENKQFMSLHVCLFDCWPVVHSGGRLTPKPNKPLPAID